MPNIAFTDEQKSHRSNDTECRKIRNILRGYMDTTPISVMAELIHVQPQSLSRKFHGDTKWDVPTLTKMCNVLNVSIEDRARMLGWRK